MENKEFNQKGAVPLMILAAIAGIIVVMGISVIAPFRDDLFYSLFPKSASNAAIEEWVQDGHDSQRTGSTTEEAVLPWTFLWSFNGPDASGSASGHFYDAPKEARTVTGNSQIYVPAGARGLYALRRSDGTQAWNITNTAFNAAPAYDSANQLLLAGGADGQIYKINSNTGSILATYNTGNPINKALLLDGGFVYAVSDNGTLNKVSISNFSSVWSYSAGSSAATLVSYSPSRDILIYATADLNVHAVNNSNGVLKWKVKPTPNNPGDTSVAATQTASGAKVGTQFDFGWPVIAENNGVVFVRLQLPHQGLYEGPNSGRWGNTNAENRTWLAQNPQWKNLFALNLDSGAEKFIPAVGYGSTEDFVPSLNSVYGVMGSQPVVKVYPDGTEVVYIHFRNGQTTPASDYRWSGHMGEMVLNDSTIPGMAAGDLRFVRMGNYAGYGGTAPVHIIDEQTPLSMAGNMLINAHWAGSMGVKITDRGVTKGLTYSNPIETSKLPTVVRAQKSCANFNPVTHYTTCSLNYVTDGGRYMDGPGFWGYWNVADPPGWRIGVPTAVGGAYSAGFLPRYTYVSGGQVVVEGNGGELLVFQHSGSAAIASPSPSASVAVQPSISPSPSVQPAPSASAQSSASPSSIETIDSTDSRIVFDGWFPTVTGSSMIGGSERVGEFGGTSITIPFTGNSITWIYTQDLNRGQAQVFMDGVLVRTVDQYGGLQYGTEEVFNVTQGSHTLRIVVTRVKQTASTGFLAGVDAFRVTQNLPSPTPTLAASPSPAKSGDLDGNNTVDIFDYNLLLTNFGRTGANIPGDADSNGKVDIFDYNIVLTNFGK